MKKWIFLGGLAAFFLTSRVQAAVQTPLDSQGHTLPTVDFVGAIPCGIDSSTGTTAVLCASGRAVVYGAIASSITATDFIVLRDSGTANVTSSTATVIFAAGTGSNSSGANTTQTIKFPVPLQFLNGISVNDNSAPSSGAARWTLLYRPLKATE